MDIAELKQQARALEQQGNIGQALEVYRQILAELDAIGGIRQELPVLIKIGDLYLKSGDVDQAIDSFERAAGEYAAQGAAQPVMSLCVKIVRADPQAVGAYLRLARRLLDNGHTDGARDVLLDYAQRAKLEKTREGLQRLTGRADDEVKRVLAKAIDSAEERVPKREPRARAPAPQPEPEEAAEPVGLEPPPEPPTPKKRLTVPVGALDSEPNPSLLEMHPPEPRPPEVTPESAFPTAEDLQAPVLPEAPPPHPAPPPAPPPMAATPLPLEPTLAPPPMEGMLSTVPPTPEPPTPQPRLSVPMMEAVVEPPAAPPTPPRAAEAWPETSGRASRPQPSPPPRPSRASARIAHPVPAKRGAPGWLWSLVGVVVVAGAVGTLLWLRIIPLDRLRNLLPLGKERPAEIAAPQPRPPVAERPDTLMARDTATVGAPSRPTAARPAPVTPPIEQPTLPPPPPTLPPGVTLTRPVMMVGGLRVESVSQIESEGRTGIAIIQVLSTGRRLILEEFPTDTTGAAGEIGVTGIPPDTVVGHVRLADLEITVKGVISEDQMVQFLQQLVEVRP